MGSKEQQEQQEMETNNEPEPPEDSNAPQVKVCLRLPNGSKETISIAATNTVQVIILSEIRLSFHHTACNIQQIIHSL